MFTKGEFFRAVVISLFVGMAIGYNKARKVCFAALAEAQTRFDIEKEKELKERDLILNSWKEGS